MCASSQRADALNALTLIENIGRLATQGLFGFLFAALAEVGKSYLTFYCNAVSGPGPEWSHFHFSSEDSDRGTHHANNANWPGGCRQLLW